MSNVCNNQADFNVAFDEAIKNNNKEAMKKAKPWVIVSLSIWLVFFVWAILLGMKLPKGSNRILHLVFAILFSPVYVLAYYLGMVADKDASMGMRRRYY